MRKTLVDRYLLRESNLLTLYLLNINPILLPLAKHISPVRKSPNSTSATSQQLRSHDSLFVDCSFRLLAPLVRFFILEEPKNRKNDRSAHSCQPYRAYQPFLAVLLTPRCASTATAAIWPRVLYSIQHKRVELQ